MSNIIVAPCFWLDADGIEREIANHLQATDGQDGDGNTPIMKALPRAGQGRGKNTKQPNDV